MLKPAKMKQVVLLILERDIDAVTERLGRLGLIEPKPADSSGDLSTIDVAQLVQQWSAVENACVALVVEMTGADPAQAPGNQMPLAEAKALVDKCSAKCLEFRDQFRKLSRKERELKSLRRELGAYRPIPAGVETLADQSFLHFAVGSMDADKAQRFVENREGEEIFFPFKTDEGEEKLIALTTRKGRWALESDLANAGFEPDPLSEGRKGVSAEVIEQIDQSLAEAEQTRRDLETRQAEYFAEYAALLAALCARARDAQRFYKAQANFARTEQTCLISGWARERVVPQIEHAVTEVAGDRAMIEHRDPDPDSDVPVCMENPKLLRPFEKLVTIYGMPCYDEVEPTLFVAMSFLLMFGIMFGDVGQGAVIAIAGWLMLKMPTLHAQLDDSGAIFVATGLSSMFFGFCYGSVFGYEHLLPPLWIEPLHNVPFLMKCTVGLGVVMLSLGIVLNVINCLRRGDYLHAFLDKSGVVGFIFYWGCLGLLIKQTFVPDSPVTSTEVAILVGAPLFLLFFRLPIFNLITHKKGLFSEEGVGMYLMESMVEMMETLSSFVGNTASFVRVSAFALAHVGLSMAVFALAEMLRDMPAGNLWAVLMIVFGNVVILLLEGLVVTIQCIRLEYYEFFSRFFKGEGRRFEPFRIAG